MEDEATDDSVAIRPVFTCEDRTYGMGAIELACEEYLGPDPIDKIMTMRIILVMMMCISPRVCSQCIQHVKERLVSMTFSSCDGVFVWNHVVSLVWGKSIPPKSVISSAPLSPLHPTERITPGVTLDI